MSSSGRNLASGLLGSVGLGLCYRAIKLKTDDEKWKEELEKYKTWTPDEKNI